MVLRPMRPEDTADVARWRNDPRIRSRLFSNETITEAGHLKWLEHIHLQGRRLEFMIVDRSTERSIGTVGLSDIDWEYGHAEYGVLIGEEAAEGKGLAREATEMILAHAFGKLGLRRVYLRVFSDNERALNLYRRVGFVQEEILRRHAYKDGLFRDVIIMAVVVEEEQD